jgi:hypothetical protein
LRPSWNEFGLLSFSVQVPLLNGVASKASLFVRGFFLLRLTLRATVFWLLSVELI